MTPAEKLDVIFHDPNHLVLTWYQASQILGALALGRVYFVLPVLYFVGSFYTALDTAYSWQSVRCIMDSPDEAQQKPPPRRTRSRVESIPREEWERMLVGDHTPIVRSTAAPHPPKLSRRVSSQQQIEPPQTTSVALPSVDLRKAALTHRLSSQGSLRNSSDSGHVSSASDGLEPPLAIALNPRTINEDERDILDVEAERESVQGSTSTGSGRSKRDVIVTSQHSRGSVASPTPLGCPRRQSLFERAHGASMAEFAIATGAPQDDWGGSEHNNNDTVAQRGKYIDPLKLEDGEPPQDEDPPPVEGHGQYHTVLRDWLMHVVEKDDNLDTEARIVEKKLKIYIV